MNAKLHPLQVKGKYYIDNDVCVCSAACEFVAPKHFATDPVTFTAYVYRQPQTLEEEDACRKAMNGCPVEAILDNGKISN